MVGYVCLEWVGVLLKRIAATPSITYDVYVRFRVVAGEPTRLDTLIGVVLGSVLTILGGFLATWYQAEVAARAAKGNRLRDIYHPMLAATRMAEAFANADVETLFDENGVMTNEAREAERKKLEELVGRLKTATESASWLEFESDKIAVHLRGSLSRLQRLLIAYGLQLFRNQINGERGMTKERARSERDAISKV